MITAASLKTQTVKELGELAKQMGLAGWHSMRKEQLVTALVRTARKQGRPAARGSSSPRPGGRTTTGRVSKGKMPNGVARSAALRKGRSATKKKSSGSKSGGTTSTGRTTRKSSRIQRVHARRRMFKDLSTPANTSEQPGARKPAAGNGKTRSVGKRKGASETKRRAVPVKAGKDRIVLLVRDAYW